MTQPSHNPSRPTGDALAAEDLLQHLAWVQRLAHRICSDAAQAEDVSQEALLAAFRSPPRHGLGLKQWLGTIVRNKARMARRTEWRRGGIEPLGARPEAQPSAADLVERVGTQRAVVDAVMGLEEPYRTTLLRRYFDELGPARIAALDGVPEATVKTRLRRGLARLREQLGSALGDEGDGAKLFGALAPLALMEQRRLRLDPVSPDALTSASAGLGVGTTVAALATVTLLSTGAWMWLSGGEPHGATSPVSEATPDQPELAPQAASAVPVEVPAAPSSTGGRSSTGTAARATEPNRPPAVATLRVNARALDTEGLPVPGLDLALTDFDRPAPRAGLAVGRTDDGGNLSFDGEPELGRLVSASEQWLTLIPGTVFPYGIEADVSLIVARPRRVGGTITTAAGELVEGARVRYGTDVDLRTRFDQPIDRAARLEWYAVTDASGAFAFEAVPELPDARLWVEAWGFESGSVVVATTGDALADCELDALAGGSAWIEGRVRLPNGSPAAGAAVSLGTYAVYADDQGRFRIDAAGEADRPNAERASELWVALAGYAPTRSQRPAGGWPASIELQLETGLLAVGGRVVDTEGNPVRGIEVDLADPSAFGYLATEGSASYLATTLEAICAGGRTGVRTDSQGRFELRGLGDRSYALVLRDDLNLELEIVGPFAAVPPRAAAGHPLELVLPEPGERVRVAGRVVDDLGQPLARARVRLARRNGELSVEGPSASVDTDGYFAFPLLQPAGAELHVFAGGGYSIVQAPLDTFADPAAIDLVLARTGSFFIRLSSDPEAADHFTLEDPGGGAVMLQQVDGQGAFTLGRGHFERGRSPVYRAPRGTRWLVLWRDGEEVERIALDLRAGPPTCITL